MTQHEDDQKLKNIRKILNFTLFCKDEKLKKVIKRNKFDEINF